MAWKDVEYLGFRNLPTTKERTIALDRARYLLTSLGYGGPQVDDHIAHEGEHLFGFPEFDSSSGRKLRLVVQQPGARRGEFDSNKPARLVVKPNKRFRKREVVASIKEVSSPSQGDIRALHKLSRFRK